jgi:hypothetical protein
MKRWLLSVGVGLAVLVCTAGDVSAQLRTVESRYYVVHHDLADEAAREVDLRLTHMAEEYHRRTAGFAGDIRDRFPFYIFTTLEGYHAAGGPEGTAGVFDPNLDRLMAFAGREFTDETWRVVQHEGFHQFAQHVIRGELPIWVNEGLAEYFGESRFCGDRMVSGLIPVDRLQRVQAMVREKRYLPMDRLLTMTHLEWNQNLAAENYDAAWMRIHFLAHADNGRFQPALVAYINALSRGQNAALAWRQAFGSTEGLEEAWSAWWTKLKPDSTLDRDVEATTIIATHWLARAINAGMKVEELNSLLQDASRGRIPAEGDQWLPTSLGERLSEDVKRLSAEGGVRFALLSDRRTPAVSATFEFNGRAMQTIGRWSKTREGRVKEVAVSTTRARDARPAAAGKSDRDAR